MPNILTGPFFERRDQIMKQITASVEKEAADFAKAAAIGNMVTSFRDPTPVYWTRIKLEKVPGGTAVHDDYGLVYGPWLEGVGSRNATTRFKGYWSMRRAAQALETEGMRAVEERLDVEVERKLN